MTQVNLCECLKCGLTLIDENPQVDAPTFEVDITSNEQTIHTLYTNLSPMKRIKDSDGSYFHGCPGCETDAYLQDVEKYYAAPVADYSPEGLMEVSYPLPDFVSETDIMQYSVYERKDNGEVQVIADFYGNNMKHRAEEHARKLNKAEKLLNTTTQLNERIAKYMEIPYQQGMYEHPLIGEYVFPEELEFHKSWDWLMPVIGKISNRCEDPAELDELKYALLCNDIDTALEFVTDYIK